MEPVKDHQGMKIIGIDNGYGNIKTANCCFPAGLTVHDAEPVFKDDLLVYDGRYYLIGTGHKEFKADKTGDDDYYILTLAAIARELNVSGHRRHPQVRKLLHRHPVVPGERTVAGPQL